MFEYQIRVVVARSSPAAMIVWFFESDDSYIRSTYILRVLELLVTTYIIIVLCVVTKVVHISNFFKKWTRVV